MTLHQLVLRYSAFAVIATLANLATQRGVLHFGESVVHYVLAVGAGTIVGLGVKYVLDKHWIFFDREGGLHSHGKKFSKYAAMGLITTVIFWGSETAFFLIWHTDIMREMGAILGLTVGYLVKYNLDKRFVFATGAAAGQAGTVS